ncbi:MAG: hypothetical protein JWM87_1503 [Candidatus Eremiobacteraeota bacterium]|nr:hypothetical protein [Candidatus Eremiobacteraeota bacterium]
MLLLLIVLATIVTVGLAAIALAEPRRYEIVAWNDDAERRLLRERKIDTGWW